MAKRRPSSSANPSQAKPRSDAYVGLLAISLLAQIAGAVLLYLDWQQYPEANPKSKVDAAIRKVSTPTTPGAPITPPGKDGKDGKDGKGGMAP